MPAMLISQDEAADLRKTISDPINRAMVTDGYRLLLMSKHVPASECDVLYFSQILAEMFSDKAQIAAELSGEGKPGPFLGD